MQRKLPAALVLLVLPLAVSPQNRGRKESDVAPVRIDAVVTGADGKRVPGLTASDFQVLQDDQRQTLSKVTYVGGTPAVPLPMGFILPVSDWTGGRKFVFLVDDLHLSPANASRVRDALSTFIRTSLPAEAEAAIVRTMSGTGESERFSADKPRLLAAAAQIEGTAGLTGQPRGATFSVGTLGTLRRVLTGLKPLNGRKSIVLISEDAGPPPGTLGEPLSTAADRAFAVLYVICPGNQAALPQDRTEPLFSALARSTGGLALDAENLDTSFERVVTDSTGYYVLEYQPPAEAYGSYTHAREFRDVTVKSTRPGLQIRYRKGLVPEWTAANAEPAETPQGDLLNALDSTFSLGDLKFSITPLFFHNATTGTFFEVLMHIDGQGLSDQLRTNRVREVRLKMLATLWRDGARPEDRAGESGGVDMLPATYEATLRNGIFYSQRLPVRRPGLYQLRVVIGDEPGGRYGSATQLVEVPDVGRTGLVLSGILLKSTANESALFADRFRPTEGISYRFDMYNLTRAPDGHSEADLEVRIKGVKDQELVSMKQPALSFPSAAELWHRSINGKLIIPDRTQPGEYTLQVTVTDRLAAQSKPVTQSTQFSVRASP